VTLVRADKTPYKPRLDWLKLIIPEPRIMQLDGGHMDLRLEPQVGVWAEYLKQSLNRPGAARTIAVDRVSPEMVADSAR
jgi:hypothetical protein